MRGVAGDGAIYIDRNGEEYRAVIQSESMIGNANIVFWEGESPDKESLKVAMNIPHKSNAADGVSCYKHKPSAEWVQELL